MKDCKVLTDISNYSSDENILTVDLRANYSGESYSNLNNYDSINVKDIVEYYGIRNYV